MFRKEIILVPLLALIVIGAYHFILSGWWRMDDTQILKYAVTYSPFEYFFLSEIWQKITLQFLTPWLLATFDLDYLLFGFNPLGFYLHHLIVLTLVALVVYKFLLQWISYIWSFLAGLLVISGTPFVISAQLLTNRHYVEGLLFITLALHLYALSLRRQSIIPACLGGLLYLLAMTCKEVFVPFIAVFIFWPQKRLQQRWPYVVPFLVPFLLYVPWRFYMLEVVFEAYGSPLPNIDYWKLVPRLAEYMFGTGVQGLMAFAGILIVLVFFLYTYRRFWLFALICVLCLVIPLVPVADHVTDTARYNLLPWWMFSLFACFIFGSSLQKKPQLSFIKALAFLFILYPSVAQSLNNMQEMRPILQRYDNVGRFIWNQSKEDYYLYLPRLLKFHPWYISGAVWLKEKSTLSNQNIRALADVRQIYEGDISYADIWYYDYAQKKMVSNVRHINSLVQAWRKRWTVKPLALTMNTTENYMVSWKLGPYEKGEYTIFLIGGDGVTKPFNVPPAGRTRFRFKEDVLTLYLKYRSPEGWITYSPHLDFKTKQGAPLIWKR